MDRTTNRRAPSGRGTSPLRRLLAIVAVLGSVGAPAVAEAEWDSLRFQDVRYDASIYRTDWERTSFTLQASIAGEGKYEPTTLYITVNGKRFYGSRRSNTIYDFKVPLADLLADQDQSIYGYVKLRTGLVFGPSYSTDSLNWSYRIQRSPITIDAYLHRITNDGVIDAAEAVPGRLVDVSGRVQSYDSGVDLREAVVAVRIGDGSFDTRLDASGYFRVAVPGAHLAAHRSARLIVTDRDWLGNEGRTEIVRDYLVDTDVPVLDVAIDPVAGDDVVNAREAAEAASSGAFVVSGTVTGEFAARDRVSLSVAGAEHGGEVDADGRYAVEVPADELAGAASLEVRASSADAVGNVGTAAATRAYAFDLEAAIAGIALSPVTPDNVLNAAESAVDVGLAGEVTGEYGAGDEVVLGVGDAEFSGALGADGRFEIAVPGATLAEHGAVRASVTVRDAAGNEGRASTSLEYAVDVASPALQIAVGVLAGDNVVNAAEVRGAIVVTGAVDGDFAAGDGVTLTLGAESYATAVAADGTWSAVLPGDVLASASAITATVAAADAAGNAASASAELGYVVDVAPPTPSIALDAVSGDDVLNAVEASRRVPVTGTVAGEFRAGDEVRVLLDGAEYVGTLDAEGRFAIDLPGAALALAERVGARVSTADDAGNAAEASTSRAFAVDVTRPAPTLALDPVGGDDVVNAAEAAGEIRIAGALGGGDFAEGDVVTLSVDGTSTDVAVDANGAFGVGVPGERLARAATVEASATVTDAAGNVGTAEAARRYAVDVTPPDTAIAIDPVTSDNAVNAAEAEAPVTVTGRLGGSFAEGDVVRLAVGDRAYDAPVDAAGAFAVDVPGSALRGDSDIVASVVTTDAAGNAATVEATASYARDTVAPAPSIALDPIAADDVVNAAEAAVTLAVAGTVTGEFAEGDVVTVAVGDVELDGALDGRGAFSIGVPGAALVAGSSVDARVATRDAAGNPGEASTSRAYAVDVASPALEIAIGVVTADNVVNAAEAGVGVVVAGSVRGEASAGDTVTLRLDGWTSAAELDADGVWSTSVPGALLAAGSSLEASVATLDAAGNPASASVRHAYAVALDGPSPAIALDPVTPDDTLNAVEARGDVRLTGSASGDVVEADAVTVLVDGTAYTGELDAAGRFAVVVPGAVLATVTTVEASVVTADAAGNRGAATASRAYAVDVEPPAAARAGVRASSSGTLEFVGTADAGADTGAGSTVSVSAADGTEACSTTVEPDGGWRCATGLPASAPPLGYEVTITDAAGNVAVATVDAPEVIDADAGAEGDAAIDGGDDVGAEVGADTDGDGLADALEGDADTDADGVVDALDLDSDDDGLPDALEAMSNAALLTVADDTGTEGTAGFAAAPVDTDADGVPDRLDLDSDNDGLSDLIETQGLAADDDGDARVDDRLDADADGLDDALAAVPVTAGDADGDGRPDHRDVDADGDGLHDLVEAGGTDADGDGAVDALADADADGVPDAIDWDAVGGADSDGDGIVDEADADQAGGTDTDGDGVIDAFDADADGDGFADPAFLDFPGGRPDLASVLEPAAGTAGPGAAPSEPAPSEPAPTGPEPAAAAATPGPVKAGTGGGGCSIGAVGGGSPDPLLPLLVAAAVWCSLRCRRLAPTALALSTALVAVATAVPGPARAAAGFERGAYAGFGVGRGGVSPDTSEAEGVEVTNGASAGAQATLGADVSERISLEAQLVELGEAELSNGATVGYRELGASALFYVGRARERHRRRGFKGFGRLGVGFLQTDPSPGLNFEQDNTAAPMLGLGVEYAHRSGLAARLEAIRFDADVGYAQLGMLYRFGGAPGRAEGPADPGISTASTPATNPAPSAEPALAPALPSRRPAPAPIPDGTLETIVFPRYAGDPTDAARARLDALAERLLADPGARVEIGAHTDSRGSAEDNRLLSRLRARRTAEHLIEAGIEPSRIESRSYGETRPAASNATARERRLNRRVEIRVHRRDGA